MHAMDEHLDEPSLSVASTGRLALSVEETAIRLGISRGGAYEAIRQGTLPSLKIGRRVLVPVVALEKMLGDQGKAT